jgi:hypothetical protein
MSNKAQALKELKRIELLAESLYKLDKKLTSTVFTLKLERDTHVPDLMTRIRILPSVAVVAQKDKVARFFDGDAQLMINIKFLPKTDDILKSIKTLAKMIKNLPGVKSIGVETYNKRKISMHGKKLIL